MDVFSVGGAAETRGGLDSQALLDSSRVMRLRCSNLGVTFPTAKGPVIALQGFDFESREGEFLTFVGPSGCGKTTLLRVLAGLLAPSSGRVERIGGPADRNSSVLLVS